MPAFHITMLEREITLKKLWSLEQKLSKPINQLQKQKKYVRKNMLPKRF